SFGAGWGPDEHHADHRAIEDVGYRDEPSGGGARPQQGTGVYPVLTVTDVSASSSALPTASSRSADRPARGWSSAGWWVAGRGGTGGGSSRSRRDSPGRAGWFECGSRGAAARSEKESRPAASARPSRPSISSGLWAQATSAALVAHRAP